MSAPEPIETIEPEHPRLRDISARQWKSGLAAWLGWLFDGLDMHLYTLVAAPFVAALLDVSDPDDPRVRATARGSRRRFCSAGRWAEGCSAGSAIGWAGAGRSRLTILTYALFTGLSSVAQTWWHLLIFRFLAALGIGGEWAMGASLLSETWPRRWRPWLAAVLQSAVNVGILLASVAAYLMAGVNPRLVFLSACCRPGWCSGSAARSPSRTSGSEAAASAGARPPAIADLFRPGLRGISDPGHPHLLVLADGALGVHVLVAAAPL